MGKKQKIKLKCDNINNSPKSKSKSGCHNVKSEVHGLHWILGRWKHIYTLIYLNSHIIS